MARNRTGKIAYQVELPEALHASVMERMQLNGWPLAPFVIMACESLLTEHEDKLRKRLKDYQIRQAQKARRKIFNERTK